MMLTLYGDSPLPAQLERPIFLYVTTTNLDSGDFVLDRAPLDETARDAWGFEEHFERFSAPPKFCDQDWYSFRLGFELGAEAKQPVDEGTYPLEEFEFSENTGTFELDVWGGLQMHGFLESVADFVNTPVDTGTW